MSERASQAALRRDAVQVRGPCEDVERFLGMQVSSREEVGNER